MGISSRSLLDTGSENEVVLEILSYAGGEDTISEDHVANSNIARVNQNWEAISVGGMQRAKGFNELVTSGETASSSDLGHFHYNDTNGSSRVLGVINGNLVMQNGGVVSGIGTAAFTADKLCHAVDGADAAWITNSTDNLKRYTTSGGIASPAGQPSSARERIYRHKNRLIAEGGGVTIYGSRVGTGNWTAADAWSASNDAWNTDLPNPTKGLVEGFPTGNEISVFTEFKTYVLGNFPNVTFRPVPNSRGCSAPYSVALGEEGVYFLSKHPTLGVFIWDGTKFVDITSFNEDVFVEKIDFDNRIFGIYRQRKYYLFYNEKSSGVTYPNRLRVFDAEHGRWMERPVNSSVSDTFGYPMVLAKQNNELYTWSSQKRKLYELETTDDSDEGFNTEASYKTKDFTSRDFVSLGRQFPLDEVKFKLTKITIVVYGTVGEVTVKWTMDRGRVTGSKTFDLTAEGDLINTTFTVNTSKVVGADSLGDKTYTESIRNDACGRTVNFEINQSGASTRPKVKKIKVHAVAVTED